MTGFYSFSWLNSIPLYTYTVTFLPIQPFIDGHIGCFHVLVIVSNIGCRYLYKLLFFISSDKHPEVGFLDNVVVKIFFSFLRNLHPDIHSDCTTLHPHQQYRRVLFSPHLHKHLSLLIFLIIAVLNRCKVIYHKVLFTPSHDY